MVVRTGPTRPKLPASRQQDSSYSTGAGSLTVSEKLEVLQELGQPELIKLFDDYRQRPRRRRSAPLDQRVSISITKQEKILLLNEVKAIEKASGEKLSMAQFIRNRGMATVDLNGWREIAVSGLRELNDLISHRKELEEDKKRYSMLVDNSEDEEDTIHYERELSLANGKLRKLTAVRSERTVKVTSRMSMAEAEAIKWRAQRLCVSTSDFLRMMLFSFEPNSHADEHLSADSRRRFYVSIMEVAKGGWGENPTTYQCSQCEHYLEELHRTQEALRQLREFAS